MTVLERFRPTLQAASLAEVDLERLRAAGVRGIICDVDNTLLPYGGEEVSEAALAWLRLATARGLAVVFATNNRSRRIRTVAAALGVPIAVGWAKPSGSMLRRAMAMMGTTPDQTAFVGDQLLTDVLAGNRAGVTTILVPPLARREFPTTRIINRSIERVLLRLLGLLPPRQPARLSKP